MSLLEPNKQLYETKEYMKWKIKLNNMLHSYNYCGICLETDTNMWQLQDCVAVDNFRHLTEQNLKYILTTVFGESMVSNLACRFLCNNCTENTIKAYNFIQYTKETFHITSLCLEHLNDNINNTLHMLESLENSDRSIMYFNLHEIFANVDKSDDCPQDTKHNNSYKIRKDNVSNKLLDKSMYGRIKRFTCNYCYKKFPSIYSLRVHKIVRHKVKVKCKTQILSTMCPTNSNKTNEYQKLIATHSPDTKYVCRICKIAFLSKFNHDCHFKRHKLGKKNCPICTKLVNARYLYAHIKTHKRVKMNEERLKEMSKEDHLHDKVFSSEKLFLQHDEKHDHKQSPVKMNEQSMKEKRHICDQCDKAFSSEMLFLQHKEKHNDHKQCPYCKKLVKETLFTNHIKSHKEGRPISRIYSCLKCNYQTPYLYTLEAHENRIHLKMRPHKCNIDSCGRDFFTLHSLKEHLKTHSDIKVFGKRCETCGNYFTNNQSLQHHIRIHTGERPYSCEVCGECFLSTGRLQEHKFRKHTTPNLPCPICKNKYPTITQLRSHVKKCHCKGLNGNEFDVKNVEGLSQEEFKLIFTDRRKL